MKNENIKKLNLGAGELKKDGYINIDWNKLANPDVCHNLNVFPYPFSDNTFDLIEASHVLEHLDRPFDVMKELHRILKPSGKLIINVPHFSRGFTHAEHSHGFDVTFPLYFNKNFTKSGFIGVEFELKDLRLSWLAFFHLLPSMGYGKTAISLLKTLNKLISILANLSPNFCSRIWCYWVGGFDEIKFEFVCLKDEFETSHVKDQRTADSFADSWNNLPLGTVSQFEDWLAPITKEKIENKTVLELGCGNASLMVLMSAWQPSYLKGVDLGDSIDSAIKNMSPLPYKNWKVAKDDLIEFNSNGFDFVYCIGVLHHLKEPKKGLDSVIRNTLAGGRFHCWVYAREGNAVIINLVDPLRKIVSRFNWRFTKYFVATPLAVPFFIYAKTLNMLRGINFIKKLPLFEYSIWIAKREFSFFRHVAFDQLVTPQTAYLSRDTISNWLKSYDQVDQDSVYMIFRNGNSWKFGGKIKSN
jgi:ubiquinone/menaquinone biosynthesis C-methylase UbiE